MILTALVLGSANYLALCFVESRLPFLILSLGLVSIGLLANFCFKLEPNPLANSWNPTTDWSIYFALLTSGCILFGSRLHKPTNKQPNFIRNSLLIATAMASANLWISSLWENFFPGEVRQIPINSQSAIPAFYICITACFLSPAFTAFICNLANSRRDDSGKISAPPIASPFAQKQFEKYLNVVVREVSWS